MTDTSSTPIPPLPDAPAPSPVVAAPIAPSGKPIPPPPRGPVKKVSDEEIATPAKPRRRRPRTGAPAEGGNGERKPGEGGKPGADPRRRGAGSGSSDRPRRPASKRSDENKAPVSFETAPEPEVETGPRVPTDDDKAKRKERVALAKDALTRALDVKGEQVAPARAMLKDYLRQLNEPNQPSDEKFQIMLEAPFRAPPKKRGSGFGFGGGGGGRR